jgi:hypothetical protein
MVLSFSYNCNPAKSNLLYSDCSNELTGIHVNRNSAVVTLFAGAVSIAECPARENKPWIGF